MERVDEAEVEAEVEEEDGEEEARDEAFTFINICDKHSWLFITQLL